MINGVGTNALEATLDAVSEEPGFAHVTFGLESDWVDGCHQRATTTDFVQNGKVVESRTARYVMESDEPAALLGTDQAASPGEYVLQAPAACYGLPSQRTPPFATSSWTHSVSRCAPILTSTDFLAWTTLYVLVHKR